MSYEAMYKVRSSGLTDRTMVDVLEALAFFHNKETGACFPSTDAISRISRVNDRLVRTTLKALHEAGYVSSEQKTGQRRYFTLHLDRLPEALPLQESTALHERTPPQKSTGTPCMKVQGTPVGKCSSPLYETTPEQGINKESNKEVEQGNDGHASSPERIPYEDAPPLDHFDVPVTDEKPGVELKPKKPKADRGSRMTIENLPEDWRAFVESEDADLDPDRLFQNFRDYWLGVSGSKGCKCDWFATWRNNVRSFKNAPDWKRRPMLKPEAANRPQYQTKFVEREKRQEDRVYGI